MGTWDIGPFDNDTAADFGGTLDRAHPDRRACLVREALLCAASTTEYLDADIGAEAVAAAALVAAQCGGEPADPHYGPAEPLPDLTALRTLAVRALDRVLAEPSELLVLWEASGDRPWETGLARLRTTLATTGTPAPATGPDDTPETG
ncbi:DUF4259 domain-containing protein [Streptomyces sp. NPDC093225]|uniref:DUF4259 domain-containing protein n=1 Tax=Streptomyces sp. NPDC093225 TaxID=3366034 RepID=UPI0037FABA04